MLFSWCTIIALHELSDAVYTSKNYWCITSPTIELYKGITELQENQYSESKYNIKDKSGQNDKKNQEEIGHNDYTLKYHHF